MIASAAVRSKDDKARGQGVDGTNVAVDAKSTRNGEQVVRREKSLGDVQLRDKHAQADDEQIEMRQLVVCAWTAREKGW